MIHPNSHPTYNERHQKIIELIDWTLEKYKIAVTATNVKKMKQQNEEPVIDNIIEELDKKRDIAINKKKKALLRDEVSIYRLEENTVDYVLFIIRVINCIKIKLKEYFLLLMSYYFILTDNILL